MKEAFRLVGSLLTFCLVAGILLAATNEATKTPIAKARVAELQSALQRVMPDADNDLDADKKEISDAEKAWTFYVGRKGAEQSGVAFESSSDKGYGGTVSVLISLAADGSVRTVEVLDASKETPGLGSKVTEPEFEGQFAGRSSADLTWAKVKKDSGDVQAVTGATISSRAATDAIRSGLDVYARHATEITVARP
jgi:electron transport complex protein RnfG